MRKITRLVSQNFDDAIGKLTPTTFSEYCWYNFGKISALSYGLGYYKGVLKLINAGSTPIAEAIYTIIFTDNELKLFSNTPINHGTMSARLDDKGEFYTLYFKPDINFLGKRTEFIIIEESGDTNRAIYSAIPCQRAIKSTSFNIINSTFIPNGDFCTPLTNVPNSNVESGKLVPCFTISFKELPAVNCVTFSLRGDSRPGICFILNFVITKTADESYCVLRRNAHLSKVYEGQDILWSYTSKSNENNITIYSKYGYSIINGNPLLLKIESVDCNEIISAVNGPQINQSMATKIPLETLV